MAQLQRFPCVQCGALLEYAIGTHSLKCKYCSAEQVIAPPKQTVEELDLLTALEEDARRLPMVNKSVVQCTACAAQFQVEGDTEATKCPFCSSSVVIPQSADVQILPGAILPFKIAEREMRDKYKQWIGSRFWAPNSLKKLALLKSDIKGIYVPYWTYDSLTTSPYSGMRGEHYYETETYTDSDGDTHTRQVQRTAWYPASGVVVVPFDDVLVLGTTRLPAKFADAMSTWQLVSIVGYETSYLAGFNALRYDISLPQGFERAKQKMAVIIEQAIRNDIGGDEQQIHSYDTHYENLTFKHVLLPIWTGSYRYSGRLWFFFVNGQTGEVRGEAPVSPWKVAAAVILGLLIIGTILYLVNK